MASLHCAHIFVNNAPGSWSDKKRKSIPNSRTALVSGNPSILMKSLILLLAFGRKPGSGGISCCFQRRGKRSYIFQAQHKEQEDSGKEEGIRKVSHLQAADTQPDWVTVSPGPAPSLPQLISLTIWCCNSVYLSASI